MKRIFKIIVISLFSVFSFYYTNKLVTISKNRDPIMQEIIKNKDSYRIAPINGVIDGDSIILGISGKEVNVQSSYEKMKSVNEYNEDLFDYTNISPVITKKGNLDKVIKGSGTVKKEISFVFKLDDISLIEQIIYILNENNTEATFFVDGKVIEDNVLHMYDLFNNKRLSFGIYGYNYIYDSTSINYNKNMILKRFNYSNYCLYKSKEFLKDCTSLKINTIKPIVINKDIYSYMKNSKRNGYIYEIDINYQNIKELSGTIIYLKQKGYRIVKIDTLLKE